MSYQRPLYALFHPDPDDPPNLVYIGHPPRATPKILTVT